MAQGHMKGAPNETYLSLLLNYTVLLYSYSGSHLTLLLLLGGWILNQNLAVGCCPSRVASHSLAHSMTDWISSGGKSETDCYSVTTWVYKVKLATKVEGNPKAPFSIASTPRCRGGCYCFPWIAPLYPWYVPYNAEC